MNELSGKKQLFIVIILFSLAILISLYATKKQVNQRYDVTLYTQSGKVIKTWNNIHCDAPTHYHNYYMIYDDESNKTFITGNVIAKKCK